MGVTVTGRLSKFAGQTKLQVETCPGCGVLFAAPEHMLDERRFNGKSFYCPSGHSMSYSGDKSELEDQLARERDRAGRLAAERDQLERSVRAERSAKAQIRNDRDRIRGRIQQGVCPCCNRQFQDLQRHMHSKHPDYVP